MCGDGAFCDDGDDVTRRRRRRSRDGWMRSVYESGNEGGRQTENETGNWNWNGAARRIPGNYY